MPATTTDLPRATGWPDLAIDLAGSFRLAVPAERDRAGASVLQRYVGAGARWWDCGDGPSTADIEQRVARALAEFAPERHPRISTTLAGESPGAPPLRVGTAPAPPHFGPLFAGGAEEAPRAIEEAVERSIHRLRRPRIDTAWIRASELRALDDPRPRRVLTAMTEPGGPLEAWGIRFPSAAVDPAMIERAIGLRPPLLALPVHLLNAPEMMPWVRAASSSGTIVAAVDPFAGGLLDGSWLAPSLSSSVATPTAPRAWPELRDAFEPVRRLDFLTADRRRTLPAAALQFLWGARGISSVVVRPRDAATFDVALRARAAAPLSAEERRRVDPATAPSRPAVGGARLK